MIAEIGLITYFTPFLFISMAVAMLVLRAGASRIFFDIVGTMQTEKLIKDTKASATIIEALYLDALIGVQEGVMELGEGFASLMDDVMPLGREIGEAQRQFEKFVDVSEDIESLNAEIVEIGHSFGFAADESFEAAAKMAQLAGVLGQGSTATGTEMGMAFGLISGMSTEAAMQRMVNLNQQTNFMTKGLNENSTAAERNNAIRENTMRILDQLNTIENTSAATMQQITFVMNQFASQAHLTGESIAAMAAMSAVLIEAGEEQGKGGRALRTVYARLGADTNGARTEIEKLGIAVIDAETGAMRPLSDILEDVSVKYKGMEGAEKSALAQTIAGNLHYTRLIKLLEGVDRMRDLEADGLEGTFPAYEEIERLQNTNLYQLEQMEAQLKSVKGALAQELMPAMTDSAKVQMVFNDTIRQMLVASPTLVGGFFRLAEMMRTTIGPFVQQMVSIINLRIAMETLNHVKRAMSREDMFRSTLTTKATTQLQQQSTQLDTHKANIAALTAKYGENNNVLRIHIGMHDKLALEMGETTYAQHQNNLAMQAGSNAVNSLSMGLGVAGTGMMAFGKSQKTIRMGMMLNTFAMMIQIGKLAASTLATTLDSIAKMKNSGVTMQQAAAAHYAAAANAVNAAAATASAMGFRALMASIAPVAGVFMLVGVAAYALAGSLNDVGGGMDKINASMMNAAAVTEIYENMTLTQINDELAEQQKIIEQTKDATEGLAKAQHDAAVQRITDLNAARDVELAGTDEIRNAIGEIESAVKPYLGMSWYKQPVLDLLSGQDGKAAMEGWKRENQDIADEVLEFMKRTGINTLAELDDFTARSLETTKEAAEETVSVTGDLFSQATDDLYEFNNAREELFYGFSSSNLTGDLIRQVKQQGVENLITNTELIVTNNFNGMTLPEMVDTITQEIESRLNLTISGN